MFLTSCKKECKMQARQEVKVGKQDWSSRGDKQERPLQRQNRGLSSQEEEGRPRLFLEIELILVYSFYGKLLVWAIGSGKNVGVNFNFYKVYFVPLCFAFMA